MSRIKNDTNNLIRQILEGHTVSAALLVELDFITGPNALGKINEFNIEPTDPDTPVMVRATNAGQDIYYYDEEEDETKVYVGVGALGSMEPVADKTMLEADTVTLRLTGVPNKLAQLAFEDHYLGRTAKIFLAVLDNNYHVVNKPQLIFSGKMENMSVSHIANEAVIEVNCISKLADWERAKGGRFNAEYQDKIINKIKLKDAREGKTYPTGWRDTAFDFIPSLIDKEINWGRSNTSGASGGFGHRGGGGRNSQALR